VPGLAVSPFLDDAMRRRRPRLDHWVVGQRHLGSLYRDAIGEFKRARRSVGLA